MKYVVKIEGPNLVGITVETVPTAVRVTLDYRDDHVMAFLLKLTETAQFAAALQAAVWEHIRAKSGDEERGPS